MSALVSVATPSKLELPYRWNDADGLVRVEIGVNHDSGHFGGEDFARGFPYCRATIERSDTDQGFEVDPFEPLGDAPHLFSFFGFSPTLFDSPHAIYRDWDFTAHTFLCERAGKLFEQTEGERREVRAVLGFEWGSSKRGEQFDRFGPKPLGAEDWNGHLPYLHGRFSEPEWTFCPDFFDHPLP